MTPAPTTHQDRLPLAPRQEWLWHDIWFMNMSDPGRASHVVHQALRMVGPLDICALERAVNEIMRRHDALRTVLGNIGRSPVQVVSPEMALVLPIIDLSNHDQDAEELSVRERGRPFDLSRGPLIRAVLLRLAEQEHVFVVGLCHIISDAWSNSVFRQELAVLYNAFVASRPSPLPRPSTQYSDFTLRQLRSLEEGSSEARLAYWTRRLRDVPPLLDLPTKRPRSEIRRFESVHQRFQLGLKLTDDLLALARGERATLFMVLLAGFNAILFHASSQPDIVIGSVISGRDHPRLESSIGMYTNILFLRTDLSGNPTFRELLRRVRRVTIEAFEHHDVSYERLLDRLLPHRDVTRPWHPMSLYHAWFSMMNLGRHNKAPEMTDLTLDLPRFRATTGAVYEIGARDSEPAIRARQNPRLVIQQTNEGLAGLFDYNKHLFDAHTVAELESAFQKLLKKVTEDADRRLHELT